MAWLKQARAGVILGCPCHDCFGETAEGGLACATVGPPGAGVGLESQGLLRRQDG